ncbi:MAG: GNAT family N-acetyltransferase, partial [Gammaproteobacteria bacterium]
MDGRPSPGSRRFGAAAGLRAEADPGRRQRGEGQGFAGLSPGAAGCGWLSDTEFGDVRRLLDGAFPESYAHPDGPGVLRWCGIRQNGALVATAVEAWSAPQVGFVAGVVTKPQVRGCGPGTS